MHVFLQISLKLFDTTFSVSAVPCGGAFYSSIISSYMEINSFTRSTKREINYKLTVKQKDELKCAFDILDESGVGTIDIQDIAIVVRALGLHVSLVNISKFIRLYDPQKTGTLDFRGFLGIVEKVMFNKFVDEEIAKAFQSYSQNGAEYITFDDIQRVAKQLNEDISEEELEELFNGADLNNDGVIDFDEFSTILRSPFLQNHGTK
ncbi:centrin 2 [Echinococcus multilocularis]|uniref:Centrin 2 n=1 Tax=Echinococcus multilocularis TaxID=6211 RepID=A0A068YC32_ECHMU|nr:centrin 2 [Echinococcus multilocularis]